MPMQCPGPNNIKLKPNPLGVTLKLAFRAYCADMGTMNPAYRAQELYCPFCGDTCRLSTPPTACGCERGCKMCQDGPDEELVTPPDELCPNGCMKVSPQVTLRAGDAVEGGTIATFNADGSPQVRVDTRSLSWAAVQRIGLQQMQPVPVGATEDMPGHDSYAMPPGTDPYRFEASLQYGVPYADVTQAQRNAIKTQRFGEIYGAGAAGIKRIIDGLAGAVAPRLNAYADQYGITPDEALADLLQKAGF